MASINKLSIRGVRAFSPDDQEQVIEFYFPVTVIVGANGCGKTTIIESLKYAVTGSLPPGNKSGQAFVHDPKSIGHTAVKANIKLRFTNRAGQQMVVVRSMELTQKKTTLAFKALDGILRTTDTRTGEKISMSHKCSELDRQIPMLLGVSKPILEHVVFCHQEDSSWPLMEGAVLKKRFDDIFDSTRYAKALKAIQETKKEYNGIVKDLKGELNGLASHKHAAKGFRQELQQQSEDLESLEEDLQVINNEIRQVKEEMARNEKIAEEVEEQKLLIDDAQRKLDAKMGVIHALKDNLKEDLTGNRSKRDLREMLRDFDAQMTQQIEIKQDLDRQVEAGERALADIRKKDQSLREQIGKLDALKSAHEGRLQRRLREMNKMASEHQIVLPTTQTQTQNMSFTQTSLADSFTTTTGGTQETAISVSAEDMRVFFKAVADKEAEIKQELEAYRKQAETDGDKIQEEFNQLSAEVMAVEREMEKLEKEQSDARSEIQDLNTQTGSQYSRIRKSDIEEMKKQAEMFAKERDKANNDPRLKEIEPEIRLKDGEIAGLKRQIEIENNALKDLRQNTEAQNAITVLKQQSASEIENLQESLNENSFVFQKFSLAAPSLPAADADEYGDELVKVIETFSARVREKHDSVQEELRKANDDQANQQRVVSEKSALLAHNKQNLASLRARLDALGSDNGPVKQFERTVDAIRHYEQKAGVTPALQGSDPQEVLAHLSSRLDDIEESASESIRPEVLAKILDQIYGMSAFTVGDSQKVQCPCCAREFNGLEDVRKFKETIDRMKDPKESPLLRANEEEVEKSRAEKTEYQQWRKVISETMQDVVDWTRMTAEAKETEVAIGDIGNDLHTRQNDLSELQDSISDLQANSDDLRDLVDASKRWTDDAGRVSRKKMAISQKKSELSYSMSGAVDRDLNQVEESLNKLQAQKEKLTNEIAGLNKEMTDLNSRIAGMSQKATQLENRYKEKKARYDQEQESNFRKKELQDRLNVIADEIPKVKSRLQKLNSKKREKQADRDRFRKLTNDELQGRRDKLRKFDNDVSSLRQIQTEIDAYEESNKEEDFARISEKIASLAQRLEAKNTELLSIKPKLKKINEKINDQESQKKLIENNIKLIDMQEDIAKLEEDVAQLTADASKVKGHDTYEKALSDLQKELDKLNQRRSHHEGRRAGFVEQIHSLKRKLKTEEYKDIDERHRVAVIKHETTQIAVADLDKYHAALDSALLRFHGIKIMEINRIVRELWNLTYKGEDISNIELVSGQEKNAKKSYNYRVVMSKGSTKLDMRGRCSAGQRVLASIVIRLALAETFCVNCGCIALDEPTVNLDYNNKRGLAIALAQIISSRAQQSNFQLIVITHDEEFVGMMKTELASQSGFSMPEKYFQVRREEAADGKHYSKIDAIDWDELV